MNKIFKKCPFCAESIQQEARICRFCGETQPALAIQDHESNRQNTVTPQSGYPSATTSPSPNKPIRNKKLISILVAVAVCILFAGAFIFYHFFFKKSAMDCSSPQVISRIENSLYKEAFQSNIRNPNNINKLKDKRLWQFFFDNRINISLSDTEPATNSDRTNTLSCQGRISIGLKGDHWEGIFKVVKAYAERSNPAWINSITNIEQLKQKIAEDLNAEITGNDITSKEKTFQYTVQQFENGEIGIDIRRSADERYPYKLGFSKPISPLLQLAIRSDIFLELLQRGHNSFEIFSNSNFSGSNAPNINTDSSTVEPRSTSSGDVPSYASVKIKQGPANSRFAAAWRLIPQPTRNRLQQSISYLPKQLEQKCRRFANAYPAGSDPHKAAYLQCQIAHENIISQGLEKFASAYQSNSNTNFNSYVNPDNIISRQDWSTYY